MEISKKAISTGNILLLLKEEEKHYGKLDCRNELMGFLTNPNERDINSLQNLLSQKESAYAKRMAALLRDLL